MSTHNSKNTKNQAQCMCNAAQVNKAEISRENTYDVERGNNHTDRLAHHEKRAASVRHMCKGPQCANKAQD
jgi:hypothetical protein